MRLSYSRDTGYNTDTDTDTDTGTDTGTDTETDTDTDYPWVYRGLSASEWKGGKLEFSSLIEKGSFDCLVLS
jgi:hypothetical protein